MIYINKRWYLYWKGLKRDFLIPASQYYFELLWLLKFVVTDSLSFGMSTIRRILTSSSIYKHSTKISRQNRKQSCNQSKARNMHYKQQIFNKMLYIFRQGIIDQIKWKKNQISGIGWRMCLPVLSSSSISIGNQMGQQKTGIPLYQETSGFDHTWTVFVKSQFPNKKTRLKKDLCIYCRHLISWPCLFALLKFIPDDLCANRETLCEYNIISILGQ